MRHIFPDCGPLSGASDPEQAVSLARIHTSDRTATVFHLTLLPGASGPLVVDMAALLPDNAGLVEVIDRPSDGGIVLVFHSGGSGVPARLPARIPAPVGGVA